MVAPTKLEKIASSSVDLNAKRVRILAFEADSRGRLSLQNCENFHLHPPIFRCSNNSFRTNDWGWGSWRKVIVKS